jgi:hypothetical protein
MTRAAVQIQACNMSLAAHPDIILIITFLAPPSAVAVSAEALQDVLLTSWLLQQLYEQTPPLPVIA